MDWATQSPSPTIDPIQTIVISIIHTIALYKAYHVFHIEGITYKIFKQSLRSMNVQVRLYETLNTTEEHDFKCRITFWTDYLRNNNFPIRTHISDDMHWPSAIPAFWSLCFYVIVIMQFPVISFGNAYLICEKRRVEVDSIARYRDQLEVFVFQSVIHSEKIWIKQLTNEKWMNVG